MVVVLGFRFCKIKDYIDRLFILLGTDKLDSPLMIFRAQLRLQCIKKISADNADALKTKQHGALTAARGHPACTEPHYRREDVWNLNSEKYVLGLGHAPLKPISVNSPPLIVRSRNSAHLANTKPSNTRIQ